MLKEFIQAKTEEKEKLRRILEEYVHETGKIIEIFSVDIQTDILDGGNGADCDVIGEYLDPAAEQCLALHRRFLENEKYLATVEGLKEDDEKMLELILGMKTLSRDEWYSNLYNELPELLVAMAQKVNEKRKNMR